MQNVNAPRNAAEAIQQANRFDRAKAIIAAGYTFTNMGDGGIAVCKPGKLAASYWINGPFCENGCDCADFTRTARPCKHMLAWSGIQAEQAEEAAGLEAQCAQYDDSRYHMELPELPEPQTPLVQMLEALQVRIVQDLDKAEAAYADRTKLRCPATHEAVVQRVYDLRGALNIINEYWGKETFGRLNLKPAQQDAFNSGYECGKDLADDRI